MRFIKKNKLWIALLSVVLLLVVFWLLVKRQDRSGIKPPRNVIILLFDAARASNFSAYGYERSTTPFIDELAKEGVLFENAYAQASWTVPSVISIFTGLYPEIHGANRGDSLLLQDKWVTLAEYFRSIDFYTVGGYANSWLGTEQNFQQGFEIWKRMNDSQAAEFVSTLLDENITRFIYTFISKNHFEHIKKEKNSIPTDLDYKNDKIIIHEKLIKRGKPIELLDKSHNFNRGEQYTWGFLLEARTGRSDIEFRLTGVRLDGSQELLDKVLFNEKRYYTFHNKDFILPADYSKIILIALPKGQKDLRQEKYSIIRPFLYAARNAPRSKPLFLYQHFLNPHEPHCSRGAEYDRLFADSLTEPRYISESAGDRLGLNVMKPITQKALIDQWIKSENNANKQLDNYDRQLRYIDDQTRKIVQSLKDSGQYEDTLLILMSDHGEEFLDHGSISHGVSLYNEIVHIPLIMIYPRCFPRGKRVSENVATIDLFPTFLDLFSEGQSPLLKDQKEKMLGKSLLPLIIGDDDSFTKRVVFATEWTPRLMAAMYKNWKIIRLKSDCYDLSYLFDLKTDPKETLNAIARAADKFQTLLKSTDDYDQEISKIAMQGSSAKSSISGKTVDKETKEELAKLGYLNIEEQAKISKDDWYCVQASRMFLLFCRILVLSLS